MRTRKRTDAPLQAARTALIVLLVPVLHGPPSRAAEPAGAEGLRYFREKIEPVLAAECYQCHSSRAEDVKGGLRLDSRAAMLQGGDSGPAVVPGEVDESLLIQAIRHEDGLAMPPKKPKLPDATIADFATWVKMGAPAPAEEEASAPRSRGRDEARRHWAFQPVARVAPPKVEDAAWVKSPVDAFVLAKLEGRGWTPAPPADRADWIRRVTFDLTGLPPTPEEVEAFEEDTSPDADERLVDRLLASPRYGERWAQHWLDVVRYAETEGYEYDRHRARRLAVPRLRDRRRSTATSRSTAS